MTAKRPEYFKITWPDGRPCHGGSGQWPLPTQDRLGRWRSGAWWRLRIDGDNPLVPCRHGLHVVERVDLSDWVRESGAFVWLADIDGERIVDGNKIAVEAARLRRPVGLVPPFIMQARAGEARRHAVKRWLIEVLEEPSPFSGARLVFGRDRLDDQREAVCPAWPSLGMIAGNQKRRYRRFLAGAIADAIRAGVDPALLQDARRAG